MSPRASAFALGALAVGSIAAGAWLAGLGEQQRQAVFLAAGSAVTFTAIVLVAVAWLSGDTRP